MRNLIESKEQIRFAKWLKVQREAGRILHYTSIPNSTWTPSFVQLQRNKAEGLNRGFPDMIILIDQPKLMVFVELKAPKPHRSVIGAEQEEWLGCLGSFPFVKAVVAYGCQEAIDYVESLLPKPKELSKESDQEKNKRIQDFLGFIHG